jgi:hypothetical protein
MSEVDGGGKRLNEGKVPLDMVPTSMLYAVARVMEYGAQKYEKDNWRRGMKWSVPYACAMRHLLKWFEGEEADEERKSFVSCIVQYCYADRVFGHLSRIR